MTDFTYETIHIYLKKRRGDPKEMECIRCGGEADEWAYDHKDSNESVSPRGYAYSQNLDHYDPMCRPCHRRFDHGDTTCRNGHLWTEETTYVYRGQRMCRECRRIYSNDYYHRVVKQKKEKTNGR